jgi:hypothetical protein
MRTIPQESFSGELLDILEETFETHHGVFLDKDTSLFVTLDQISAAEASVPVGGRCATIAAQVEHVVFYLEVLGKHIAGQEIGPLDWGEIWARVGGVTATEWDEMRARLRTTYQWIVEMLRGIEDWEQNDAIGASMAIMVHTAYHLGEIRQALCTVGRPGQQAEETVTDES